MRLNFVRAAPKRRPLPHFTLSFLPLRLFQRRVSLTNATLTFEALHVCALSCCFAVYAERGEIGNTSVRL